MKKYAVMDEVFDIMTTGRFERLTEQQLIDAYLNRSETDAQLINVFDSEQAAVDCLNKLELCSPKKIDFHHGLVHIAILRPIDADEGRHRITAYGAIMKARVGLCGRDDTTESISGEEQPCGF